MCFPSGLGGSHLQRGYIKALLSGQKQAAEQSRAMEIRHSA